jgi:hypothetical protein
MHKKAIGRYECVHAMTAAHPCGSIAPLLNEILDFRDTAGRSSRVEAAIKPSQ